MIKKALIFGITGQDGSYLAKLLLNKKYKVYGVKRRLSNIQTDRIDDIYEDPLTKNKKLELFYGDITDSSLISYLIYKIKPDEIYNLAAQSHVGVSFENPVYTAEVNAIGVLKILEVIRNFSNIKKIKFYQASSSEMFGDTKTNLQNEKTLFNPDSPYATSKLFGHHITKNYRESYGIFACNGILFNHESPLRGETFVTKKIIKGLVNVKNNLQKKITIGNLYSKRDWGYAEDYVVAMWLMLQQKKPDDFVIATGHQYTIKDFCNKVMKKLDIKYKWIGKNMSEKAVYIDTNKTIIDINKKYFRPKDVTNLRGSSNKAKRILGWKNRTSIGILIDKMINHELNSLDKIK